MAAWNEYIHSDPTVLVGKPVIRGTRISVSFLLDLYAAGWTETMILERCSPWRIAFSIRL
jgi:uncharacterized protein (DUF433 family)